VFPVPAVCNIVT